MDTEYTKLTDYYKLCVQPYTIKEYVEQLLKYKHKTEFYNSLKSLVIRKFPVTGNMLNERGCPKSKKMGNILIQLKIIWAESSFTLSAEELLDKHLPKVLESLKSPIQSPSNKKMKTTN